MRKRIKTQIFVTLLSLVFVLVSCGKTNETKSKFAENKALDAGVTLSYDQLVVAVGAEKANVIWQGASSEFNRLSFALGASNAITLVNNTACPEHMVNLLTELKAGRVVTLVHKIDDYGDVVKSSNLLNSTAPGSSLDTIERLTKLLNAIHTYGSNSDCTVSTARIEGKITNLVKAIAPSVGLDTNETVYSVANVTPAKQIQNIEKLAKVVAHLTDDKYTSALIPLMNKLDGGAVVNRLGRIIATITDGDRLVEVVQTTDVPDKVVRLIKEIDTNDVMAGNKLSTLISGVDNGTKMGYIISNSTTDATAFSPNAYDGLNTSGVDKLIYLVNKLDWQAGPSNDGIDRLTKLVNKAESGDTWTGQVNNYTWGSAGKEKPAGTDSTVPRLAKLINAINEPEDLVYIMKNVSDYDILRYLINDVKDADDMVTLINNLTQKPSATGTFPGAYSNSLETLTAILNGLASTASTDAWKLRVIVDGCRVDTYTMTTHGQNGFGNGGAGNGPCAAANQAAYTALLTKTIHFINNTNAKHFDGPLPNVTSTSYDVDALSNAKMVDLMKGGGATYATADVANRYYPEKMITLIYDINDAEKLANVVNGINSSTKAAPENTAVNTLVYTMKNVTDSQKLVGVITELTAAYSSEPKSEVMRLTFLVNELSKFQANAVTNDPNNVAGKKLVAVINDISKTSDLSYVVNNVRTGDGNANTVQGLRALAIMFSELPNAAAVTNKISPLMEVLSHECSVAIASTIAETKANCTAAGGTWAHQTPTPATFDYTNGNRKNSTNIAKLVNMLEFVDYNPQKRTQAIKDLAEVVTNTTDINKMAMLTDNVANSTNVVGLVNAVLNATDSKPEDLYKLLNAIELKDVPKLIKIVTDVTGATETSATVTTPSVIQNDVGALMGDYAKDGAGKANDITKGVGYQHMATLIRHTTDLDAAGRLASVLNGLNANITYNGNNIPRKQALVRLLLVNQHGETQTFKPNVYTPPVTNINFPAVGPYHLSILMNNASSANALVTLMNGVNLMDALVVIGCADHVGDYATPTGTHDGDDKTINGINTPNPNFETPCKAMPGSAW